jgi:hypothetical protein
MKHLSTMKHPSVPTALVVLVALVTACGSTEARTSISVTGAVTFNGAPVPGGQVKILDSFGVTVAATDIANGRYSVSAEITPETCNPTAITILARDDSGATIGLDNADLGRCGEHVVDFAFESGGVQMSERRDGRASGSGHAERENRSVKLLARTILES